MDAAHLSQPGKEALRHNIPYTAWTKSPAVVAACILKPEMAWSVVRWLSRHVAYVGCAPKSINKLHVPLRAVFV